MVYRPCLSTALRRQAAGFGIVYVLGILALLVLIGVTYFSANRSNPPAQLTQGARITSTVISQANEIRLAAVSCLGSNDAYPNCPSGNGPCAITGLLCGGNNLWTQTGRFAPVMLEGVFGTGWQYINDAQGARLTLPLTNPFEEVMYNRFSAQFNPGEWERAPASGVPATATFWIYRTP